ncbi:MAG: tetratricopeptide repeat protein [Pseudomonadota bacterium]
MLRSAFIPSVLKGSALVALLGLSACETYPDPFAELTVLDRDVGPDAEASIERGRASLRYKDYSSAKKHFISSINQGGMNAAALTGIGLAEEGFGHLNEAERFFRLALKLAPDSIMAHNNLGVVLFRNEKYHEAQQAFQSAFAISSGRSSIAQHNLRLANLAVAEIDANEAGVVEAFNLQRIGTSEYLLQNTTVSVTDIEEITTE